MAAVTIKKLQINLLLDNKSIRIRIPINYVIERKTQFSVKKIKQSKM